MCLDLAVATRATRSTIATRRNVAKSKDHEARRPGPPLDHPAQMNACACLTKSPNLWLIASMELVLAVAAAIGVGAFAKMARNRSMIFWFLGTMLAVFICEIPLRLMMAGGGASPEAKTITVTMVIGGVAFLLALGSSRKSPKSLG